MKRLACILFLTIPVIGCRKPYNPPAIAEPDGYLVIEGVINAGADSTTIKLSHTVNISSNFTKNPVLGATVAVESDQHITFPLAETTNGNYVSAGLNLDNTHTYRLNIKTTDNKQYQSNFVPVNVTPPIDSIGFNIVNVPDTGIIIYANTHDPTNAVHYYRWDYNEDWEFHSKYISNFISTGDSLAQRTPDQYVSTCYTKDASSDIVLGSSAKLNQDVIYQDPMIFISSKSEKIEARYRVVVREYALTGDAYTFWVELKKNTEQLGSIFDAQPSQLQSNIHCISSPSEPVIGYLSVCTVTTKTRFIYNYQLPAWEPDYPYTCNIDTAAKAGGGINYRDLVYSPDEFLATDPWPRGARYPDPPGYYWTSRECADCTIRATKIPPPFWR